MGQDLARFHPIDLGEERVPKELLQRHPRAMWKESRITGEIIPWGNLQCPEPAKVPLNYAEFSRLCAPLVAQARRMKMTQAVLESTAFTLLPKMGLRYRPLRPEFAVTNLQILFRGLRRLCSKNRYLEGPVWRTPGREAEEDAFVDWFRLSGREPRPQTYGANHFQITDAALRYWYQQALKPPVEPLFIGQRRDEGGRRWNGYLVHLQPSPRRQQPYVDDLTWDPMDNLRNINPPCRRTLCRARSCVMRKALDGTGLYQRSNN